LTEWKLLSLLCFGSGTLQAAQVQDNDLLMLEPRPAARAQPQQAQQTQAMARNRDGTLQNPQAFLDSCLSNPAAMAQLPPNLRDAVSSGDIDSVQGVFRQLQREAEQRQMEAQLIRPGEDPMDLEVQVCFFPLIALNTHCGHCCAAFCCTCLPAKHRKLLACLCQVDLTLHSHCPLQTRIAEYIRQKNVEENFEAAMEFNPEVFAQVTMLYVTMDVGTSQCLHSMTQTWLVNLFCILSFAVHCIL